MTRSPLWREFESGDSFLLRLLRCADSGLGGLLFLVFAGVLELTWPQQAVLGSADGAAGDLDGPQLDFVPGDADADAAVVLLDVPVWVLAHVDGCQVLLRSGDDVDRAGCVLHLAAGAGGVLCVRHPVSRATCRRCGRCAARRCRCRKTPDNWPEVDLLIPTYNEPLNVVRYTALAAMNIDWPADKLNVYILDDGKREEFRAFAEEAGIGYMTRDDNAHAKAGNINRALERLDAPFVAIFDSDHVPTRSFLQVTMGWFVRDREAGDAADAASLLFARSVRAQPGAVPHYSE